MVSGRSEWHAYRKVKCKVAIESRMKDGEMLFGIGMYRVNSLHTHVEAQNKVVKIEAETQTIAGCQLVHEL